MIFFFFLKRWKMPAPLHSMRITDSTGWQGPQLLDNWIKKSSFLLPVGQYLPLSLLADAPSPHLSHPSLSTQVLFSHSSYSPVVLFATQQPNNVMEKMWFSLCKKNVNLTSSYLLPEKKDKWHLSYRLFFSVCAVFFCVCPYEISRKTL